MGVIIHGVVYPLMANRSAHIAGREATSCGRSRRSYYSLRMLGARRSRISASIRDSQSALNIPPPCCCELIPRCICYMNPEPYDVTACALPV